MPATTDPKHPAYLDEKSVRDELTRIFDICDGCRLCVDLCGSFPTLFDMIDRHDDHDAGRLTPTQQDQVVDQCYQCKLCHVNCPYAPELHDLAVDVPRLMLRATAMRHSAGQSTIRRRATTQVLSRTDLIGNVASRTHGLVNRVIGAPAGSIVHRIATRLAGVSAVRLPSPYSEQRFSSWFGRRTSDVTARRQGKVTVFPTCFVEYQGTQIGKDLVNVYERNGVECSNTAAGCCGAPWLHSGDIGHFTKVAAKNVEVLADEIRNGGDIVVPDPACGSVLKRDYPAYVGGPDAELVAEHTYDAAEYLVELHRGDDTELDTRFDAGFTGAVAPKITYHVSGHLLAQQIGIPGRDLMRTTGADVALVQGSSGSEVLWGVRPGSATSETGAARRLAALIRDADGDVVAGDSYLANRVIAEQTGTAPIHPIQLIARWYGIPKDA
jgi:glycerol-3-phosphate dehydrogenase subunit C